MPRVSVITATYNRSEVLRWAIASLRAQTFQDWEQIIVGDACTDDTAQLVASVADPRLTFVNRAVNCGEQSGPNNDGFKLAQGSLIAYLNHDDLWFPDHLAELVSFIDETGADLVYALPLNVDQHGVAFCGVTNAELRYDPSHLVPASFWLARRALIEQLHGFRRPTEIDARVPSQDLLLRAWQLGKDLRCSPRFTAVWLPAGGRPRSYVLRNDREQQELWRRMQEPGYRERLAMSMAASLSREVHRLSATRGDRWNWTIDRVFGRLRLNPDALRNWRTGRKRGWRVDDSRTARGLPRLADRDS